MKKFYFVEKEIEFIPDFLGEGRNYGRYLVREVTAKSLKGAKAARKAGIGRLFEEESRNGHFLTWATGEVVYG